MGPQGRVTSSIPADCQKRNIRGAHGRARVGWGRVFVIIVVVAFIIISCIIITYHVHVISYYTWRRKKQRETKRRYIQIKWNILRFRSVSIGRRSSCVVASGRSHNRTSERRDGLSSRWFTMHFGVVFFFHFFHFFRAFLHTQFIDPSSVCTRR